jgi:HD superfamily phosphohydrolase
MHSESSPAPNPKGLHKAKIVVDNVHGDITPSELEWKVIDTPSFQRLRKLKQLQMGYLVYPNATHSRFAHSIGVLHIMQRILERAGEGIKQQEQEDLRLAALMHDIGHYPYSHLLEGIDNLILTEERINPGLKSPVTTFTRYPKHEAVGQEILLHQPDLLTILGGPDRAARVGHLFARTKVTDQQLSKLIHSSLDMDRMDYLIRDSQAAGVPYGLVDIHYLLNHIKRSKTGAIGITHKAVAAAEHLLLARSFLFRVVCYHKTTYGLEEAARQLLRRIRDRLQQHNKGDPKARGYGIPRDGNEVIEIARCRKRLPLFTDAFLDDVFIKASEDDEPDEAIRTLAKCLVSRRPPRLVWEKRTFKKRDKDNQDGELFQDKCALHLKKIAESHELRPEQFLICEPKAIGFESRGAHVPMAEAKKFLDEAPHEEMIQVFPTPDAEEPVDIVSLKHSLLHVIGSHVFQMYRLYVVCNNEAEENEAKQIKEELKSWR